MTSVLQRTIQAQLDSETSAPNGPAGVVFGAVNGQGKVLACVASGNEELGNSSRPMKTDSVFCLYSCSKMITGIACMQLVEQGRVGLDDAAIVEKLLPEVANATLVDGSKPNTKITLRMLLSHTSGFAYTFFHHDVKNFSVKLNGELDEFCGNIEGIKTPLVHEPGTDWQYGVGLDWAGELVHRLTGMTLGEYCRKNIFEPLGAHSIAFGLLPEHKGRLVEMHQRDVNGKLSVSKHLDFITKGSTFDSGGAGCVGTISDYMKIMVVLLNEGVGANGARILKAETVDSMFEDQVAHFKHKPLERRIPDATPKLTYPIDMMPGVEKGWGLTFEITKDDLPNGRKANSVWWAGLPNNYWSVDRESGIGTMILSQSFPFNDMKVILPWLNAEGAVYQSLKTQRTVA